MTEISKLRETPHWSYSAFNTYLACPLKYRFQYLDCAPVEKTGSCFPFGRAFHAALSERARQGAAMNDTEIKACFADFLQVETAAADNLAYKEGESYDTLIASGKAMLDVALDEWGDDYAVKSVAEGFSVLVPGLSKPLIGEFDLVVTDGDAETIVDWKTSSMKWAAGKADRSLQCSAFCYAYRQTYGKSPLFRFDVYTKTKTPAHYTHYTRRTEDDLHRFELTVQALERNIAAGNFYPNETSLSCTDCPYKERCKTIHQKGGFLWA
ncbi:MAG: PD-(D/E)XK nuclease family protein [Victivallaceae bacterium]|nr:PD-(D/E)XK nuclease family protein [Victivallaceae bacterium]